jgi:hypothetical protein
MIETRLGLQSIPKRKHPLQASRLRDVKRTRENTAWGSYRTEFYPTDDRGPIGIWARRET